MKTLQWQFGLCWLPLKCVGFCSRRQLIYWTFSLILSKLVAWFVWMVFLRPQQNTGNFHKLFLLWHIRTHVSKYCVTSRSSIQLTIPLLYPSSCSLLFLTESLPGTHVAWYLSKDSRVPRFLVPHLCTATPLLYPESIYNLQPPQHNQTSFFVSSAKWLLFFVGL